MGCKLPSFLYIIKSVLFVSVLLSLLFLNNLTSAVIFLIAVAVDCSDLYITNKYGVKSIGAINSRVFDIIDRLIMMLPLLFSTIWGNLAVWVLLIVVTFEAIVLIYRSFEIGDRKLRKIRKVLYFIYNLVLYFSIICFLIEKFNLAQYSLFGAVMFSAIVVILSSVSICLNLASKKKDESNNGEIGIVVKTVQSIDGEIVE